MKFIFDTNSLIKWFLANKREMPWRSDRTAYRVWISEIMLQQTQVKTVIPYYLKFLKKFNSVKSLAKADEETVLKYWEGLGYYSRARNLHKAAKLIALNFNNRIPEKYDELIKLPGFGPYTTAAVLSIAYGKKFAVVDGNVIRVISRVFAIKDDISDTKTKNMIQKIVDLNIPEKCSSDFNEAIMELGAIICKVDSPLCQSCPLQKNCLAYKNKLTSKLPYKKKKKKVPTKHHFVFLITNGDKILIQKRPSAGLLANLWEFPWAEDKDKLKQFETIKNIGMIKHQYSHFKLLLDFFVIKNSQEIKLSDNQKWISTNKKDKYPFHKAHSKIFELFLKNRHII